MSNIDPSATTLSDAVVAALQECGRLGTGQTPSGDDLNKAWARTQWKLQQWERKRWMVYQLVTLSIVSTGAQSYTVGPGGQIDTGAGSVRPAKLESAFLRQLTQSQPNQIDYPLELLQSKEDYNRIALKQLMSFPSAIYYDPGFPLGTIYPWPVPQANIYGVYITVMAQLPANFKAAADKIVLPYEYYWAIVTNVAIMLRGTFQIPTFPGDPLPGQAKDALNTIRTANLQIARLQLPDLGRPLLYNIFSDRMY